MCGLFGMLDLNQTFSGKKKAKMIAALAQASEVRGTDATGIAYNSGGSLNICKRPVPAHQMRFRIPSDAKVIMGHTRMTTQGSAKRQENNHPFRGEVDGSGFALAHNGVLYNDIELRLSENLPDTSIETDSYIAVQLIEQQGTLNFGSLKRMAEKVEGSFAFSVLDEGDTLFLIKGDNPLCIYHFHKPDVYLYASTEEILTKAIRRMHIALGAPQRIPVNDGEILRIDRDGTIARDTFNIQPTSLFRYVPRYFRLYDRPAPKQSTYRKQLLEFGEEMGVSTRELEWLDRMGLSDSDLENAIFDDGFRIDLLIGAGYYDDLEGGWFDESACRYAW